MSVTLNDVNKHVAEKAIITMVREANRKGGYKDQLAKLQDKEAGLAVHIYTLATRASQLAGRKQAQIEEWFLALCKQAETHLKSVALKELGHEVENVKDELPCWPVFKSNIKRAIKAGLDPQAFDTYTAFNRARLDKESNAGRDRGDGNHNESSEGSEGTQGESGGGQGTTRTQVTPTLQAALNVMAKRINGMTGDQQDAFAQRLSELLSEFVGDEQPEETQPAEVASGEAAEAADERKSA